MKQLQVESKINSHEKRRTFIFKNITVEAPPAKEYDNVPFEGMKRKNIKSDARGIRTGLAGTAGRRSTIEPPGQPEDQCVNA